MWLPVYYDFSAKEDAQDSRFVALGKDEVNPDKHFPLKSFFDPVGFSKAVSGLTEERNVEIVKVQEKFKEALIPAETFETEDRTRVAIVFERVNRMGVELDMFELLTAWTWSEEFDLQQRFIELSEEFADFGFEAVGSDNDLMLRCCSAILKEDPSPSAMIDINGAEVRDKFELVENALRLAIDFLRNNLQVRHVKFLPYSAQLIPLAAYFSHDQSKSVPSSHAKTLLRWFWRSTFAHRYSGNPARNIKHDVAQAIALRKRRSSTLDNIRVSVDEEFFLNNVFNTRTVASKALILLLANSQPKSFLSGRAIDLNAVLSEPNRKEYHHCMPKGWIRDFRSNVPDRLTNSLANYSIIARAENREIRDKAPSVYRGLMPSDISEISTSAFLPESLWKDDEGRFFEERAALLARAADSRIA